MSVELLVCHDIRAAHWKLGPLPPTYGNLSLLGWSQTPPAWNAGVPFEIQCVLSQALTAETKVAFPSVVNDVRNNQLKPCEGNDLQFLRHKTIWYSIKAALFNRRSCDALIITQRPALVCRLFNDAGYPWHLQGHVVLLFAKDADLPLIDHRIICNLCGDNWSRAAYTMVDAGLLGVLRPGVDGDVAGLLALDKDFQNRFFQILRQQAEYSSIPCTIVDETILQDRLRE